MDGSIVVWGSCAVLSLVNTDWYCRLSRSKLTGILKEFTKKHLLEV